jgi:hypothetical protein
VTVAWKHRNLLSAMKRMLPTISRCRPLAGIVVLALFWGGCATTHQVTVNAIAHPEKPSGTSYRVVTRGGGDPEGNLRDEEVVRYVKTALSGRGLYEAPNPEAAEMVVEVDYGVEPPRTKFQQTSAPIYVRTGGGVTTTVVPVIGPDGRVSYRRIAVYEPPRNELVGFDERVVPVTVYEKYLRISARENRPYSEDNPPAELWSVHVSNEDESKDIRARLPILASAAIDFIGVNTEKDKTVRMREDSDDVAFVRQGM